MRSSITVFSTATFFFCIATAVASQPDKFKLYGVPRKAAAASRAVQKGKGRASYLLFHEGHKKNLRTPPKTKNIKVKEDSHDPDRRLTQEDIIRGEKTKDSTQRKHWNTSFEADVAMPIRLQSTMKKASGDSNRRLQTAECYEQDNGLLACVVEDFPADGVATIFFDCPVSATTVSECQSCAIVVTADDTLPECTSCSICSDSVAYDCSNIGEGDCVIQDCDGTCTASDGGGGGGGGDEQCEDVPGWYDSDGDDCNFYAEGDNCQLYGSDFENDGYTANDACCACGGGNIDGGGGGGGGDNGVVYGLQPSCNSVDNDNYNMCLDIVSVSGSYESWMDAFAKAIQRWESIIVGDLPSSSSSTLNVEPEFWCTGYPSTIDDVYICAQDGYIDGDGDANGRNVLGFANFHYRRGSGVVNPRTGEQYQVAFTGYMKFDSADIAAMQADGTFEEVVFHEMAHVLGLGTLWELNELYDEGSGEYASGTHADDEWKAIGCSGPLPVELDHGPGSDDAHWDEECLGNELMTGGISGTSQPVSKITIGTLEDMGYEVDYSQANAFTIADLGVCGSSCPEARRELRGNNRKRKAKLGSEDLDVVMRYAKTELAKWHEAFETAALVRGDRNDGITAVEELHVLYQDAKGRLHTVHVTWDEVKDLQI